MAGWQLVDNVADSDNTLVVGSYVGAVNELVVDVGGKERNWKFAEVLLESRGDRIDVEIGVRDIRIIATLKHLFYCICLRLTPRFAVNAFTFHAFKLSAHVD